MKSLILLFALFGFSLSAVIPDNKAATIINYENTNNGDGNYEFSFETSNGIKRSETSWLVNAGQPDEHIEIKGQFSYIDSEGQLVIVRYIADEKGYRELGPPTLQRPPATFPPALVASLIG